MHRPGAACRRPPIPVRPAAVAARAYFTSSTLVSVTVTNCFIGMVIF